MIKRYYLEELNIQEIIDFISEVQSEDYCTGEILLESWGWKTQLFDMVWKLINETPELFKFIVAYAGSAAFNLIYNTKAEVELLEDWDWVVHVAAVHMPYFNKKVRTSNPIEIGRINYYDSEEIKPYDFLTEEEKKDFIDWKDIYIDPIRMKKIFNKPKAKWKKRGK